MSSRLKYAHQLLDSWGANLSMSRVAKLVRSYGDVAHRIPFEHYLLNNADLSELQRVRLRNWQHVVDPTGQIATVNLDRTGAGKEIRANAAARGGDAHASSRE